MIPKIEGKVVVGFPAVGKSALSFNYPYVIDLESSNFYLDSERYIQHNIIFQTLKLK